MDELISKKAAIDVMAELQGRASTKAELKGISKAWKRIKQLQPIQPEIVRCKDCKHWKDSDGVFRRGTGAESKCPLNLHQVYEGTFFCGLAERREVTNGN